MRKICFVLLVSIIVMSGCSVKEGFTTFGALESKIDNYLINVDVSDASKSSVKLTNPIYGDVDIEGYKNAEGTVYIKAALSRDNTIRSYEVFYIDDLLTYIVEIRTEYDQNTSKENSKISEEELREYIVLEGKATVFNTEDSVLEVMETDDYLTELISFLESKM